MQLFWNIGSFNNMNLLKDQTGVGRYQGQKSKSTNTNEMSLHQHMTCRFAAVKKSFHSRYLEWTPGSDGESIPSPDSGL